MQSRGREAARLLLLKSICLALAANSRKVAAVFTSLLGCMHFVCYAYSFVHHNGSGLEPKKHQDGHHNRYTCERLVSMQSCAFRLSTDLQALLATVAARSTTTDQCRNNNQTAGPMLHTGYANLVPPVRLICAPGNDQEAPCRAAVWQAVHNSTTCELAKCAAQPGGMAQATPQVYKARAFTAYFPRRQGACQPTHH